MVARTHWVLLYYSATAAATAAAMTAVRETQICGERRSIDSGLYFQTRDSRTNNVGHSTQFMTSVV
eukprot:scaffold1052_cov50-Attheya_sp.AAC.1